MSCRRKKSRVHGLLIILYLYILLAICSILCMLACIYVQPRLIIALKFQPLITVLRDDRRIRRI